MKNNKDFLDKFYSNMKKNSNLTRKVNNDIDQ